MGNNEEEKKQIDQLINDVSEIKSTFRSSKLWRETVENELKDVKASIESLGGEVQRLTLAVVGDKSLGMHGLVETLHDLNETIKDFKKESPNLVRVPDLHGLESKINDKLTDQDERLTDIEKFKIQMVAYWLCGTTVSGFIGYLIGVAKAAVVAKASTP